MADLWGETVVLLESAIDMVLCLQNSSQSLLIWEIFGASLLMHEHQISLGKPLLVIPANGNNTYGELLFQEPELLWGVIRCDNIFLGASNGAGRASSVQLVQPTS